MPWSQAVIFKVFDWLENWDITLILVAPKKLVLGTVNVRDTDALAIVISEEHNTLSLFLNGNIKKNLTSVKLRSHIVEYLDGDYNKKLN